MVAGFSGIVGFYTVGPFILINKYGMTPQNFGFLSIAIIGCAFIARLYMSIISLKKFGAIVTSNFIWLLTAVFVSHYLRSFSAPYTHKAWDDQYFV